MEILSNLNSIAHTLTAAASMIIGGILLYGNKGDKRHVNLGNYYFWAMMFTNISSLFIMKAFGKWFFPHYLALVTLFFLIPGYLFGKYKWGKHWLKFHISGFVLSYYLLIGGAINEAFLHVPSLRHYIINNDPVVGISHGIAQLIFIGILIYFLRKYWKWNWNAEK